MTKDRLVQTLGFVIGAVGTCCSSSGSHAPKPLRHPLLGRGLIQQVLPASERFGSLARLRDAAFADRVHEYERLEISWEQFPPRALPWLLVKLRPIAVCVCDQSRAEPDEFCSADQTPP
jgi:hypothetical protein